jgi:hypothetical protein
MPLIRQDQPIALEHASRIATRLEQPQSKRSFVRAQMKRRVVELTRHRQRPPAGAERQRLFNGPRHRISRCIDDQRRGAAISIESNVHVRVLNSIGLNITSNRRQRDAGRLTRPPARVSKRAGALLDVRGKVLGPNDRVDQTPIDRPLAAHAVRRGAEHVGVIAADATLVDQPRQPASSREYSEQRHFGQADGR